MFIKKPNVTKKIPFYRFFICGCLDFLGGYFLNKSFAQTSPCLIVFLTQMIYPFSIFAELIIKKRNELQNIKELQNTFKKLLVFAILSCACFVVNYKQENDNFRFSFFGIFYVLISDIFYMSNTFYQSFIVQHTGPFLYLRNFSFSGFVYCVILFLADFKSFNAFIHFYKTYYTNLIFYTISLTLFYLFASPYINKFGGVVFNSSVITGSVYCGIYYLFSTELNIKFMVCHLLCITADLVIVYLEKNK